MDDDAPIDTGVGDDVVTITAPVHTLNWALVGIVAVGIWWLYSTLSPFGEDDDED